MYSYVAVYCESFGVLYQEALDLNVVRYLKTDGTYVFDAVPPNNDVFVVDASPSRLDWML